MVFDRDTEQAIFVTDTPRCDSRDFSRAKGDGDVMAAIAAIAGAEHAHLLHFDFGSPHGHPSDAPSSLFPWRGESVSALRQELERLAASGVGQASPFWLPGDPAFCLPLLIEGRRATCVMLSYAMPLSHAARGEAEKKAALVIPLAKSHVQAAETLSRLSQKFDGAMGFLDGTHVGVILFDNQGAMVLANSAARAILDAHDGIRMGNRAPVPVSLRDASRFHLALEHQIAENAVRRKAQRKGTVLLIQREGRRPFVATLIPVNVPAVQAGDPAVMLYLFDPSQDQVEHLDAVCELYGLSRVEARLAQHIAAGKTLDEAAVAMRIKAPTARTYLKHIFMKTGTHRQTDLVRLLMLSTGRMSATADPEALL